MTQVLIHDCQEMKDETRSMSATVVTLNNPGISENRTINLTQTLRWRKKKVYYICTESVSQYAFTTSYVHSMIYRERGLLIAEKNDIEKS